MTTRRKAGEPHKIKHRMKKWKPSLLVRIYQLSRLGMTDVDMVKELGISRETLWKWRQDFPEIKEVEEQARKEVEESKNLPNWVYSRLSPEMKEMWNKVEKWGKQKDGVAKIELMLCDHGRRVRQELFLHALCMCSFSPSQAMNKVNITKKELDRWLREDEEFATLVKEVDWHKGNFFEEHLVKLVQEGNPAAVVFANKTYNTDRGYGRRDQLDVNVTGQVLHGVLDLVELMPLLSEGARLELVEAIRRKDEEKNPQLTVTQKIEREILEHGQE
jgi:transposase-like protein